ncbi:unnamed protein product [Amaranthus hypochondriacus]
MPTYCLKEGTILCKHKKQHTNNKFAQSLGLKQKQLVLNFDAEDSSGTISLTAFTDIIEQLFEKPVEELYEPTTTENIEAYHNIAHVLQTKLIYMLLGPATSLSKNGVLKWVLKSISVIPIDFRESGTTGTSSASSSV